MDLIGIKETAIIKKKRFGPTVKIKIKVVLSTVLEEL
jgi:hypothetical protein